LRDKSHTFRPRLGRFQRILCGARPAPPGPLPPGFCGPWWALPFLPPLAYVVALLAFEGRTLLREVGYLRSQLSAERAS
jgi:hypothetical protein